MIEKTVKDLNYANYKLIYYEDGRTFLEVKDSISYRIINKKLSYRFEKLEEGLETLAEKTFKKEPSEIELLNWAISILEPKPTKPSFDEWLDEDDGIMLLKEILLQKTKNGYKISYRNPDEDIQYSIESSSMPALIKAIESTLKEE